MRPGSHKTAHKGRDSSDDAVSWRVEAVDFCCCVVAPHDIREAERQMMMMMTSRRASDDDVRHLVAGPPLTNGHRRLLTVGCRTAAGTTGPAELATKLGCARIISTRYITGREQFLTNN